LAKDKDIIKGNGHISVSNVNALNSECITLTYTIGNFKNSKQVTTVRNELFDLVDQEISFDLLVTNWDGEDEKLKLRAKIKSCNNEKKAHTIKAAIDEFIKKKGGQTILDETFEDNQ